MIFTYKTLATVGEGEFKDRGSKFIGYATPVQNEQDALDFLEKIKKEHIKARHHCFAWRLGQDGAVFRANDDGEPSGTAGRPILGQIDSVGLTFVFVVVVRYFGGTLLGTSGLIQAYRAAAAAAIENAEIIHKTIHSRLKIRFDYALMPDLMNALKKLDLPVLSQTFDHDGLIETSIRIDQTNETIRQLKAKILNVTSEHADTLEWPSGMEVTVSGVEDIG